MSLQKQSKSDYSTKVVNTLFNPFEHTNILSPTNATPFRKGVYHAGALAAGYGMLGFALRKLIQEKDKAGFTEDAEKLRQYANAKYPIVSMGAKPPSLAEERKRRELGVVSKEDYRELEMVDKEAGEGAIPAAGETAGPRSGLWSLLTKSPLGTPARDAISANQHTTAPALALAAAVLGTAGGWQLADYVADRQRREKLKADIEAKNNKINKLVHSEFARTRGLNKSAKQRSASDYFAGKETPGESASPLGALGAGLTNPAGAARGMEALGWVVAAASLALGYTAGKTHMDTNDPARQRMKELKQIARDHARVKGAPILMDVSDLPSTEGSIKQSKVKKPRTSVSLPGRTEVDADDPYANLLIG